MDAQIEKLDGWSIQRVPREEKGRANTLVRVAGLPIQEAMLLPIYLQVTHSISLEWVNDIVQVNLGWMEVIKKHFHTGEVLEDEKQAHKIQVQSFY